MKNRIITRMKKQAASHDQISQKLSDVINSVLYELIEEKLTGVGLDPLPNALDMIIEYDEEYKNLGTKINGIIDDLEGIAEGFVEDYQGKLGIK